MKKFFLILILLLSAVLVGAHLLNTINSGMIVNMIPALEGLFLGVESFFASLRALVAPLLGTFVIWFQDLVIYLVLAVLFTIVYLIIFGIIGAIIKSARKKRINEALGGKPITLSEEEQAKFDWKLHEKRFPTGRLIFILLEILLIVAFVIIRFDYVYVTPGAYLPDGFSLFNEEGQAAGAVVDQLAKEGGLVFTIFYNLSPSLGDIGHGLAILVGTYIQFINSLFLQGIFPAEQALLIEIVLIVVVALVLILLTFAIGSIFAPLIRKSNAKKRAKKAKEKYIRKLEDKEYKAWVKSGRESRVSEKNRQLYNEEKETDNITDVTPIAVPVNKEVKQEVAGQTPEQNYIDDISTGVTDLGLVEEDNNEIQRPLTSRETRFVGEEENDIVLEEEPIIETIEEEESYYNDKIEEIDDNFEKYQPETTKDLALEDKVRKYNIDVIEEDTKVTPFKENVTPAIQEFEDRELLAPTVKEEVEPTPVVEEVVEEKPVIAPIEVEKKVEEVEIEDVVQPTIKPTQPIAVTKKASLSSVKPVSTKRRKPIRPVDVIDEKGKAAEYIVNTSDSSQLAMSEEELENTKVEERPTRAPRASALTRNPTSRSKTSSTKKSTSATKKPSGTKKASTTRKSTTVKKPATAAKKPVANKPTSAASQKLAKPAKPVSAKVSK